MKVAKGDIYSQANSIPELKFEDQQLTSIAGLVVFQKLFRNCRLKERMEESCAHLLQKEAFQTVTMDFDGSVQSTKRHAEGTAVGLNFV